jgi:hypothetical protein
MPAWLRETPFSRSGKRFRKSTIIESNRLMELHQTYRISGKGARLTQRGLLTTKILGSTFRVLCHDELFMTQQYHCPQKNPLML